MGDYDAMHQINERDNARAFRMTRGYWPSLGQRYRPPENSITNAMTCDCGHTTRHENTPIKECEKCGASWR